MHSLDFVHKMDACESSYWAGSRRYACSALRFYWCRGVTHHCRNSIFILYRSILFCFYFFPSSLIVLYSHHHQTKVCLLLSMIDARITIFDTADKGVIFEMGVTANYYSQTGTDMRSHCRYAKNIFKIDPWLYHDNWIKSKTYCYYFNKCYLIKEMYYISFCVIQCSTCVIINKNYSRNYIIYKHLWNLLQYLRKIFPIHASIWASFTY